MGEYQTSCSFPGVSSLHPCDFNILLSSLTFISLQHKKITCAKVAISFLFSKKKVTFLQLDYGSVAKMWHGSMSIGILTVYGGFLLKTFSVEVIDSE